MVGQPPRAINGTQYPLFRQLEEALQEFGTELNLGTLTAVALIDWWAFRFR
ncbi:hypothetical protein INT82_02420 [Mannheimia haemolytica]|nr:hypothetical protein [Mannheimia haemolytica]